VLTVLAAGGAYTGFNWLIAILLCSCVFMNYASLSTDQNSDVADSNNIRLILLLFSLVTTFFTVRYSLCQWFGNFESRLPVGAHWLGPPVSLAAFVSSWSVWMFGFLSFFVASRLNRTGVLIVGWVFVLLVVFETIYGFISFRNQSDMILGLYPRESIKDVAGTFVNRNLFAAFMAMATPFGLAAIYHSRGISLLGRMFALTVVAIIATMAVIESHSRLGFVAYAAGVGLVGWYVAKKEGVGVRKRLLILLAAVAIVFVVFLQIGGDVLVNRFAQLSNATARIQIWSTVFDIPFSYWLLGIGPGNTELVVRQLLPPDFDPVIAHLHNEPMQFLLEFGVVFSGLMFVVVCWYVKNYEKRKWHGLQIAALCSVFAGFISAFGDYPYRMPGLAITCCILLGILANGRLRQRS